MYISKFAGRGRPYSPVVWSLQCTMRVCSAESEVSGIWVLVTHTYFPASSRRTGLMVQMVDGLFESLSRRPSVITVEISTPLSVKVRDAAATAAVQFTVS